MAFITAFRKLPLSFQIISLSSLLLAFILLLDRLPILRGGEIFHWQWPYQPLPTLGILLLLLTILFYGLISLTLARRDSGWIRLTAFIFTLVFALLIITLRHGDPIQTLFFRTLSPTTTGPHLAAARIDWQSDDWLHWTQVMTDMQDLSVHVALSPPALPMLYAGFTAILEPFPTLNEQIESPLLAWQCHNFSFLSLSSSQRASALLGILMPLWAALGVFPLYAIGRRLLPSSKAYLTAFWPLIPALILFAGSWNTVYPLVALIAFWAFLKAYEQSAIWRSSLYWLMAGLALGLLNFANFSTVPLILMFGFYTLLHYAFNERQTQPLYRPLLIGFCFAAGLLLPWILFILAGGDTPFQMLAVAFDQHLSLNRPYLPWLWMHFWEWALLTGLPLIALTLLAAFTTRRHQSVLALALGFTFIILLLSNTARGETSRVWLFFAPFALLAAGTMIEHWQRAGYNKTWLWRLTLGLQALFFFVLASTWQVIDAPDIQPPPPPPPAHENLQAVDALFDNQFRLIGWKGEFIEDHINLSFNWLSEADQIRQPYFFSALAVAPDGSTPTKALSWQADQTRYPTTCWQTGQIVGDSIQIPLVDQAMEGDWFISLRAFADPAHPLDSLTISNPPAQTDIQIGLGPIPIAPKIRQN
ncbi:hypothetical protein MASR2M15_16280 [Anaerolineales bacterium]